MKRVAKWIGFTLAGLAALLVVAAAVLYVASERVVHRKYDVPLVAVAVPTHAAAVAEGQRLATIRGCNGCHGESMTGDVFFDEPNVARVVAPNLTSIVPTYSDAELARLLRHGVRANGESVFGMPSDMFHGLSDADLGRIIAFLRTLRPVDGMEYDVSLGPMGRLGVVLGEFPPRASLIDHTAPPAPAPLPGDTLGHGAYLARTVCTECHGADLGGNERGIPPLTIASAYSPGDFVRLMRTGRGLGDRELGLMSSVARGRFRHFTDAEIAALHAYLMTLGQTSARAGES